jgi:hypothetical protein
MRMIVDRPPPFLQHWITLEVDIAPCVTIGSNMGRQRTLYPIIGGQVYGSGLVGEVLAGGFDDYQQGADGVGLMDARYAIRMSDGEALLVHNRGSLVLTPEGLKQEQQGIWPLDASLYLGRCQPVFHAGEGPYAWVNQQIFVGTVHYPGNDRVDIAVYKLC